MNLFVSIQSSLEVGPGYAFGPLKAVFRYNGSYYFIYMRAREDLFILTLESGEYTKAREWTKNVLWAL